MDDTSEFILRSTRLVNFKFTVTKKVEDKPKFLIIKADTDTLVHDFRLALKKKITDTLCIKCSIFRVQLYESLCTCIYLVVQVLLISKQKYLEPYKVIHTVFYYVYD